MANTLTAIMPKVLARALLVLRERAVMPRLVNGDYSVEAAKKGSTIDVPVPSAKSATDVTPAATPPTPGDTAVTTVQVTLENWKKVNFYLTDKDIQYIDRNESYLPMELAEAARALANAINATIFAEYLGVYGYTGVFDGTQTVPFNSTDGVLDATDARRVLNTQLAPLDSRRGVIDFTAEANALALPAFSDAEKVQSALVKMEGEIGRKFGLDWVADDAVPTHTAGTLSDGSSHKALVNEAGGLAAGSTDVDIDSTTLTGTVVVGDVFQVAGDSGTYVVTANATAAGNAIAGMAFSPANAVLWADDAVIKFANDHVVNLAFHRDAFAFAMRPLLETTTDLALGNQLLSLTDPVTGLVLRLEVSRQYKQTMWELDALWGAKLVRPELACRIAGA